MHGLSGVANRVAGGGAPGTTESLLIDSWIIEPDHAGLADSSQTDHSAILEIVTKLRRSAVHLESTGRICNVSNYPRLRNAVYHSPIQVTSLGVFCVKTILSFGLLTVLCATCAADRNTDISPVLAKTTDVLLDDNFERSEPGKGWVGVKGDWRIVDGILIGKELPTDKHAAVLNYQQKNRNSVVRFSFRFDGSTKGFNFSLNHAKGHLFRVIVAPTGLTVRTDKDKKDSSVKSELIGQAKGKFESGQWYTLQVEMIDDRVVAMTDNGLKVSGQHARLDTDKPNYRFVMKGDSLSIDDLKIWGVK